MKKTMNYLRGCVILLMLVAPLGGCSKDESMTAPSGSTIVINPTSVDVTDGTPTTTAHTQYFTITVLNGNGKPMNNAEINIFFQWAVPDIAGVVLLYDGGTPMPSPFVAQTDENGVYNLRFDFLSGGGLSYSGDLEVRSGTAFGSAEVNVQ